jgi:hypothetical protein
VVLSAGTKVAAVSALATALPSLPAQALGTKWWRKPGKPGKGGTGTGTGAGTGNNCFLRGTSITTPKGGVCIEDLQVGDLVETVNGKAMQIKWVGHQIYKKSGPSWASSVMPIRISRHALDEQTPSKDLYLSPNHALFMDGVLIRVKDLVNGISIAPALPAGRDMIEYFHIVLDTHEVILAEGVPAETFLLTTSNHQNFMNFPEYERLYRTTAPVAMAPFAPIIGYEGGIENLKALLRLGASRFIDVRDPIQDACKRIAARAKQQVVS